LGSTISSSLIDGRSYELNEKFEHYPFLLGTLHKKVAEVDNRIGTRIDGIAAALYLPTAQIPRRMAGLQEKRYG
jgi:hypothetical protein